MLNSRKSQLALLISTLGVGAVAPQISFAQGNVLEEVIVTAQKRDESLQDVPITIAALSAEKLETSNFSSVNDLPAMVPALRIDASGAFFQPTVRGVGSSIAGVGFSSNIATYVDGFYIPSQATTNMQMLNLQNVQVLKGPQGTLFGRNATGGAILLTMLEPSEQPTATVKASYGSYNKSNLSVYGSSGLTDTLAADVSGYWEKSDGYVKNTLTGADDDAEVDRRGIRVSALWNATDDMSFKLAYDHHDWDDGTPDATGAYKGQSAASLLSPAVLGRPAQIAQKPKRVSNDEETAFSAQIDGLYLTSRFTIGELELVSYTMGRRETNQQRLDLDSSSDPWFHTVFDIENDSFSQEFNLSGNAFDDKLDWIVGLYYLNVNEDYTDLRVRGLAVSGGLAQMGLNVPVSDFFSLYNVGSQIETEAIFTDMTYNFTDEWMFTLGMRYSRESAEGMVNLHSFQSKLLAGSPLPVGKTFFDDDWGSFTPRGVLAYKPTDRSKIYLSVSKGFKAGQVSPSSLDTITVDPENILAYELGYKLSDSLYQFDASVFYYDYKDMQVASYNGVAALVTNAATSTIYGAETQLTVAISDELTANFGAAYVHGEYDDYPTAPYFAQDTNPLSQSYGTFPATSRDASGNDMQRSPKVTASLGLQYETPISVGTIRTNLDYYYTSKFYFDVANQYEQDAYGLLNLNVSWIDPGQNWTLSIYGKNLTNEAYRNQVLAGAFAVSDAWGEPAVYGASVQYKY